MKFDLSVLPDDWFLGIWWAEFGPGKSPLMPKGGQWMFVVRALPVVGSSDPLAWTREEVIRECGVVEWRRVALGFTTGTKAGEIEFALSRLLWMAEHVEARGDWIEIGGGGTLLRMMIEAGLRLPKWMSVHIREHRAATAGCGGDIR